MYGKSLSPRSVFGLLAREDALYVAWLIADSDRPVSSRWLRRQLFDRRGRPARSVRHWLTSFTDARLVRRRYCHNRGGYLYTATKELGALLSIAGVCDRTFWSPEQIAEQIAVQFESFGPDYFRRVAESGKAGG